MLTTAARCNLSLQGNGNLGVDFVHKTQQLVLCVLPNLLLLVTGKLLTVFAVR